mmetsp:Transcript_27260/g.65279  ORF Transcript_27260/g.65279 Transcript_27260/m.65279 type:complete len:1191 (+) Transcript_27260:359-3931(+)
MTADADVAEIDVVSSGMPAAENITDGAPAGDDDGDGSERKENGNHISVPRQPISVDLTNDAIAGVSLNGVDVDASDVEEEDDDDNEDEEGKKDALNHPAAGGAPAGAPADAANDASNIHAGNPSTDDDPILLMKDRMINIIAASTEHNRSFHTQISALTDRDDGSFYDKRSPLSTTTPPSPSLPHENQLQTSTLEDSRPAAKGPNRPKASFDLPPTQPRKGVVKTSSPAAPEATDVDVIGSDSIGKDLRQLYHDHNINPNDSSNSNNDVAVDSGVSTGDDKTARTAATGTKSVTFGGQVELPPLPVPPLEETLQRFLQCLQALQDYPEQTEEAKQSVLEFLQDQSPSGGPNLQRLLVEYDRVGRANGEIGSYVEEFWNDAYLAPDSSVVLNLNPYFLVEDSPDPVLAKSNGRDATNDAPSSSRHLCVRRAANLCFASVKLASQLRNEDFKPDTLRNGKPLCMDQFRALFGASRIPNRQTKDTIEVYEESNHVAVLCCKQLYYFQALWPDGDVAVDEGDIFDILHAVHSHAHKKDKYEASQEAVGVLTSLGRKEWATARQELIQHREQNADSLQIIDSALFVLVLDDYIPPTRHDAAANMLHGSYELSQVPGEYSEYQSGTCTNRWYDKLQIIVCSDGTAGINFEHSAIDGHTALRFVSDIYADTVIAFAQSITKMVSAHETIPNVINATVKRAVTALDSQGRTTLDVFPKKIHLDIPDVVKRKIYFAETALGDQVVASETQVLEFKEYGKDFITSNKLSPDSYVQMSMMLAYYKLYGRVVCAYEPVLTKSFFHGRTEAMRPATLEAKHLCEVFCNPRSSADEKSSGLRNATRVHSQLVKECARGKGVDRHLFALRCIAEKNGIPIPDFFRSEPWRMLNHTVLSTSNCGNPSLALFGFGPVVPDGLGIGYIIKEAGLSFSISSKHRQTTRYALTLEAVLREMAQLFSPTRKAQVRDAPPMPPQRATLKTIACNDIAYDSYGDIWGENDPGTPVRQKAILPPPVLRKESSGVVRLHVPTRLGNEDPSLPLVEKSSSSIKEMRILPDVKEDRLKSSERRWSAEIEINAHDRAAIFAAAAEMSDLNLDDDDVDDTANVVIVPMKSHNEHDTPNKRKMQKRRGSWDMMPRKPDRRGSARSLVSPSVEDPNSPRAHARRNKFVGPAKRQSSFGYCELSKKGTAIELDDDKGRGKNG